MAKLLVVLAARRLEKLDKVKQAVVEKGGCASVKQLDVLDFAAVEAAMEEIARDLGALDGAFNNAGGGGTPTRFGDAIMPDWRSTFELNFYGTINCMRAEVAVMAKQGHGAIVNNLSLQNYVSMPLQSHYGASKRAILAVQECAAPEHIGDGIRINSVSPAFTLPSVALGGFLEAFPDIEPKLHTPQGRLLDVETDVYPHVAMLLDDSCSRAVTGVDIPITGGMHLNSLKL